MIVVAVAVVVAFFLCWAPFHAQRLMTAFIPDDDWTHTLMEIQSVLFYISGKHLHMILISFSLINKDKISSLIVLIL